MTIDEINNNYLRLEKIKKRLKYNTEQVEEIIKRLLIIFEDEQYFKDGCLTESDIVKIYELLTGEIV